MTIELLWLVAVIAVFISVLALWNTYAILKDLAAIKEKLGIQNEKKSPFLNKDLN